MDIATNQLSQLLTAQITAKAANSLMLGELLAATVIKRNSSESITIKLKGNVIDAKMQNNLPVKSGDKIQLRVESVQSPIQLKLIQPTTIHPRQAQEQLLRETLPKQTKLDQLINTIKPGNIVRAERLPIAVKQQLQQLIDQFPKPNQLQHAPALKESMLNSGLFFEAKILQQFKSLVQKQISVKSTLTFPVNTSLATLLPLAKDLKAELLNLKNIIRQESKTSVHQLKSSSYESSPASNTKQTNRTDAVKTSGAQTNKQHVNLVQSSSTNFITKEMTQHSSLPNTRSNTVAFNPIQILDTDTLIKQVESSIARIETNQARAINTEINPGHHFIVEIPVKDKDELDLLTIDLEQDSDVDKSDTDTNWTVRLKIDFGERGHMYANVSLYEGEIQLSVWSENKNIDQLIDKNLAKLNNKLERQGLSVARCQHINPMPIDSHQARHSNNLISIRL